MFHMVNEIGNVHRHVTTEEKRDRLIELGYREVKVKEKKPKSAPKTDSKARDEA